MIKELSVEFLANIHAQYPDAQVLNFENNGNKMFSLISECIEISIIQNLEKFQKVLFLNLRANKI